MEAVQFWANIDIRCVDRNACAQIKTFATAELAQQLSFFSSLAFFALLPRHLEQLIVLSFQNPYSFFRLLEARHHNPFRVLAHALSVTLLLLLSIESGVGLVVLLFATAQPAYIPARVKGMEGVHLDTCFLTVQSHILMHCLVLDRSGLGKLDHSASCFVFRSFALHFPLALTSVVVQQNSRCGLNHIHLL